MPSGAEPDFVKLFFRPLGIRSPTRFPGTATCAMREAACSVGTSLAVTLGMGCGPTILLVEDHKDTQEALASLLTIAGYVVRTAEDGAKALETLQLTPCDLIVLDWRLPGMDGAQILRAVRKELMLVDVPVIVISADFGLVAHRVHAAGGTALLLKPFDPEMLMAVIAQRLRGGEQRWTLQ